MNKIYLDNAATTKPLPEVIEEVRKYLDEMWYNPSSLYYDGTKVKKELDKARKVIANSINADPDEIYFTSGGSESNSWIIQGFIKESLINNKKPFIITSPIEHKSIEKCLESMKLFGIRVIEIPVNKEGFINIDSLKFMLSIYDTKKHPTLVTIQAANNEIGSIQDVKTISNICHNYNAIFHTDAVQLYGKRYIDVKYLGIDAMSVSGHKLNVPKGIGFLYKKNNVNITPLIYGTQESGLRGGTENIPYIMGLKKAVELLTPEKIYKNTNNSRTIYKYLSDKLLKRNFIINGVNDSNRIYSIINVTIPKDISSESLTYMLDTVGVKISPGSACNSFSNKPSHVLKAIGLSDEECMRSFRISFSNDISLNDIDDFLYRLDKETLLLKNVKGE